MVVLADSLSGGTQEYGLGETVMGASGERQGSANVHNRGGLTSILFSRDGAAAPGTAKWGWWPEGFLHEMTHNLGAVQWGAPHSTQPAGQTNPQFGHCWQGADVMCYVESAGASHAMQTDCAALPGRDPADLRLRSRRLLQPGAARGLLPGDALEHLRQRLPGVLRRGRPGLRRRPAVGARAARGDRRARRWPAARAAVRR